MGDGWRKRGKTKCDHVSDEWQKETEKKQIYSSLMHYLPELSTKEHGRTLVWAWGLWGRGLLAVHTHHSLNLSALTHERTGRKCRRGYMMPSCTSWSIVLVVVLALKNCVREIGSDGVRIRAHVSPVRSGQGG